ncbi:MAG: hypothetical protein JSR73_12160 [Proteobacteria bacterium]|nr:hypothetical protein [Pseudomonadota bacterium]
MTSEEIPGLIGRGNSVAESMERELNRLNTTPPSLADVLLGRLTHRLDFASADAMLRELKAVPPELQHKVVVHFGEHQTTDLIRDRLVTALAGAEAYRRFKQ